MTTVLSGPCCAATMYSALANMSMMPPKAASAATPPGIRSDRFPARPSTPKNATDTDRAATRGHNPASGLVRASDR